MPAAWPTRSSTVALAGGDRVGVPQGTAGGTRDVVYGIRPEHLDLCAAGEAGGFDAEVVVVEPTGSETQVFVRLGEQELVGVFRERHDFQPGQRVRLKPRTDKAHLFDPQGGQRI